MKACGNTPPLNIKNKNAWIGNERLRYAKLFDIPMAEALPSGFPQNTVHAQRALVAVSLIRPRQLGDAIAALYEASFARSQDIHRLDDIKPILMQIFGGTVTRDIVDKATSDDVKKLLVANTDKALLDGSFGLPWLVATNAKGQKESYWGFDHIAQVADHLGLKRPQPGSASEGGWRAML
ncbi:MAG: hypothetical protein Q9163_003008 [Psora crenata]